MPSRRTNYRNSPPPPRRRRKRRGRGWGLALCLLAALALAGAAALAARAGVFALPTPHAAPTADTVPTATPEPQAEAEPTGIVVAIDAGHGGVNPNIGSWDYGAQSGDMNESDITWQTANALLALLQADGRFAPLLTTDGQTYLKGSERGAVAAAAGAELVLSIHFNSDTLYGSRGFECYPAPPLLATNADSLRFGFLLADAFSAAGLPLRGETGVRYLYYDDNDNKLVFESSDTTPRTDPTFTLLETCGCPAVLAEQCFITDATDAALFATDTGCQQAAELYYGCICAYFGVEAGE